MLLKSSSWSFKSLGSFEPAIESPQITIKSGEKLGQGMFIKYYDTIDYDSEKISNRQGGFGSTGE